MVSGEGQSKEDEATILLINTLFRTPDELLPELTEISRNAVLPLSIQMMREAIFDPIRLDNHIPLSKVWRIAYMRLMRSVGRKHFLLGVNLAQDQVEENEQEEAKWEQ